MINAVNYIVSIIRHSAMLLLVCLLLFAVCPQKAYAVSVGTDGVTINDDVVYSHDEYLKVCGTSVFAQKYNEATTSCWSCDIIDKMMGAMASVADALGSAVAGLGLQILLVGAAIWLAIHFLKSLASTSQQDVSQVLDGAFTFMFKVALVYGLVAMGVSGIVSEVVNPLLDIGLDASQLIGGF